MVLEREPLPVRPKPAITSSAMKTMPYLVASVAHAGQVSGRRDQDAGGADDGLQDDRRDGVAGPRTDDLLQVLQRALALLLSVVAWNAERYRYGPEEVHDARSRTRSASGAGRRSA